MRSLDDSSIIGVNNIRFDCLKQINNLTVNILRGQFIIKGLKEAI